MRSLVLWVRPRHLSVPLVLFGLTAVAMFIWPGFVARVADRCGQPALDVRMYWTAADATALLEACGAQGREAFGTCSCST